MQLYKAHRFAAEAAPTDTYIFLNIFLAGLTTRLPTNGKQQFKFAYETVNIRIAPYIHLEYNEHQIDQ